MGTTKETGDFETLPGIRLYRGDRDALEEFYPKAGYNRIIRHLVHEHVLKMKAKFDQRAGARGLGAPITITDEELNDD